MPGKQLLKSQKQHWMPEMLGFVMWKGSNMDSNLNERLNPPLTETPSFPCGVQKNE